MTKRLFQTNPSHLFTQNSTHLQIAVSCRVAVANPVWCGQRLQSDARQTSDHDFVWYQQVCCLWQERVDVTFGLSRSSLLNVGGGRGKDQRNKLGVIHPFYSAPTRLKGPGKSPPVVSNHVLWQLGSPVLVPSLTSFGGTNRAFFTASATAQRFLPWRWESNKKRSYGPFSLVCELGSRLLVFWLFVFSR